MLKGITSLIVIVLLLIIVGIGTIGYILVKQSSTPTTTTTTIKINQNELNLIIDIPKTSVNTGETFNGNYIIENKGKSFMAYEVRICRREGYERKHILEGIGLLGKSTIGLSACEITESYTSDAEIFRYAGTYVYELEVYSCDQIEKTLGIACSKDIGYYTVVAQIPPLSKAKKTVIVTGETVTPKCHSNAECTQICEGCIQGHYICDLGKGECIKCFMNSHCKSGYNCENNDCIKSEKTCAESGGMDCSTTKGCMGKMFRVSDTDYCCTGSCI